MTLPEIAAFESSLQRLRIVVNAGDDPALAHFSLGRSEWVIGVVGQGFSPGTEVVSWEAV